MCQKGEGPMLIGLRVRFWYGKFGKAEGRTADPSATLRFGRDDKGEGCAFIEVGEVGCEQQVPPSHTQKPQ